MIAVEVVSTLCFAFKGVTFYLKGWRLKILTLICVTTAGLSASASISQEKGPRTKVDTSDQPDVESMV